jgi:hypothetical protein
VLVVGGRLAGREVRAQRPGRDDQALLAGELAAVRQVGEPLPEGPDLGGRVRGPAQALGQGLEVGRDGLAGHHDLRERAGLAGPDPDPVNHRGEIDEQPVLLVAVARVDGHADRRRPRRAGAEPVHGRGLARHRDDREQESVRDDPDPPGHRCRHRGAGSSGGEPRRRLHRAHRPVAVRQAAPAAAISRADTPASGSPAPAAAAAAA